MAVVFSNNGKTTLSANVSSSATSISVSDGSVFPSLGSGEIFFCTLDDGTNNEIVKVTAISSNTLTVVRAQESTTARAFSAGDAAELRLTAGILGLFSQTGVAITDEVEAYLDGGNSTPTFASIVSNGTITSGAITSTGNATFNSSQLKIQNASPILILKDTSDDDDHQIQFRDSNDAFLFGIQTQNADTGDSLTFYSVTDDIVHRIGSTNRLTVDGLGIGVTGNISVSGTVDGRDIATDGSKLDGIETGATADQTQADINALGITQVGTITSGTWNGGVIASAYLDSDTAHLSGSQTFTGVKTFNTNVIIGGATYASYGSGSTDITGLINGSTFGSIQYASGSGHHVIGLRDNDNNDSFAVISGSGNYATDSTYDKLVFRAQANGTVTVGGGNLAVTGNITLTGTVDGRDIATDGSKLDGIESGATADQTASEILTAINTVDGSGSGLDADLLDGQHGSYYTNATNINSGTISDARLPESVPRFKAYSTYSTIDQHSNFISFYNISTGSPGGSYYSGIQSVLYNDQKYGWQLIGNSTNNATEDLYIRKINNNTYGSWARLWTASSDGSGSGLDADLLDGQHGSHYLNYNNFTNTPTIPTNNNQLTNGAGYITGNQTITLSGDVSGSGTTSISVTVADDSHNHVISNVDGLQTALDAKLTSSSGLNASNLTSGTVPSARLSLSASDIPNLDASKITSGRIADARMSTAYSETRIGQSSHSLVSFTSQSDYSKRAGYSTMMRGTSTNSSVVGTPATASYWFYNVHAKRDTSGGTAATLINYTAPHNFYSGVAQTTSGSFTWAKHWTDANDGSGSGLDADLLDGQHGSHYLDYNNFTNTPTIPSLSGYATESYVNTQVSNLVDSAPGTLDTLNELAAALGDDANFSTTITNSIAGKLSLTGGTLSGNLAFSDDGEGISFYGGESIKKTSGTGIVITALSTRSLDTLLQIDRGSGGTRYSVYHEGYHPEADTLTTPRTIAGTSFDGSANIDISYDNLTNKPTNIANSDTVDNLHASSFIRSDTADSFTGTLTGGTGANILLNSNVGDNGTTAFASMTGRLEFDDDYSDTVRGPNKIVTYEDGSWIAGLGIHSSTAAYYSGHTHAWYKSNSTTSFTQNMALSNTGSLSTLVQGTVWGASNDGSGSGLDADTLDGTQASGFHTVTSSASNAGNGNLSIGYDSTNLYSYVQSHGSKPLRLNPVGNAVQIGSGNTVWHAGNDGSGSSLDADLLDGQHGSHYLNYNNFTNTPTIPTNNNQLTNGAGYITSSGNTSGTAGGLSGTPNITVGTISSGAISTSANLDMNANNIIDVNQINGTGGTGWLDFNMDADSVYPQASTDNQTVLGSITHMNFVGDSNGNGTGGIFYWGYGVNKDDGGTFTQTMSLDRSGVLTVGTINTGQGATEVHLMNQSVRTTDSPTFDELTVTDFVKASGNNIKFSAGGTHVLNMDLNRKIYPQTDNSTDLGFNSSTSRFRDAYFSGVGNFGTINTGQGATEVYLMNQNVRSSDSPTFANLNLGASGTTPQINMLFNDHSSGAGWDTRIEIGKSDDLGAGTGTFPTYVPSGAYGTSIQANSDGVFFGMEEYSSGNFRPIIQWGDDDTDTPFRIKHENGSEFTVSYNGIATATTRLSAPQVYATVASGTAPLVVTSTTLVSNLNADRLDSQHGSYYLDYNNFTNTPTIPSLSGYATESYVNTQVSNLVDSAPGTLNTLNELAAALGDDANFSTTVTNSIATKLPLAGGTLTGTLNARDIKISSGYHLMRSDHHSGHLEGSYNNVGDNGSKSNPIYTIGSSYNPTDAALSNMYGIGFCHSNASFISFTGASGWGLYVASDGDARIFLGGGNGVISSTGEHYVGSSRVFHDTYHPNADKWTTARTLSLSGDASGSVSWDGSANATLSVAVADDSHNHVISNVDGLQTALDAKLTSSSNLNASNLSSGTVDTARLPEFIEERFIYNSNDSNGVYMPMVKGGLYSTSASSVTGAIKIKIPDTMDKDNNMMQFYVDIYEYTTGESMTFRISGYTYNSQTWYNTSVVNLSDDTDRDFTVRFYGNETNDTSYVAIGETNSQWAYPQVNVRDWFSGYNTSEAESQGTWEISFVTSFDGTLRHTHNNNFPAVEVANINGLTSTVTELNYTDGVTSNIQTQLNAKLASSSYTASDVLTKIKTVDGSGSGLDADQLDGQNGTYYNHRRYTDSTNYLGGYYVSGGAEKPNSSALGAGKLKPIMLGSSNLGFGGAWNDVLWMSTYTGTDVKRSTAFVSSKYDNTSVWVVKQNYDSSSWGTGYLFWNSGNDGSGSGLDADLLDGQHGSYYAPTANPTFTGTVTGTQFKWNVDSAGHNYLGTDIYDALVLHSRPGETIYYGSGETSSSVKAHRFMSSTTNNTTGLGNEVFSITAGGSAALSGTSFTAGGNTVWHAGNDGSGSGLDADSVDGVGITTSSMADGTVMIATSSTQMGPASSQKFGRGTYGQHTEYAVGGPSGSAASTGYIGNNYPIVGGNSDDFVISGGADVVIGQGGYARLRFDGSYAYFFQSPKLGASLVDNGNVTRINSSGNMFPNQLTVGSSPSKNMEFASSTLTVGSVDDDDFYLNLKGFGGNSNIYMDDADIYVNGTSNSTAAYKFASNGHFHSNGDVIAYSSTLTTSDRRLKENIVPLDSSLDKINKLQGVKYDWKNKDKGTNQLGLIAQEVEKVVPEVVKEIKDGLGDISGMKVVNYTALVPVLIEAIKEQQKELEYMKAEIKTLKGEK